MKIKEIIVVEGKSDTVAVQNAVHADTIETNGSAINEEVIKKIKLAQETRGVIVLTDPDFPGERIRKIISAHVPGCKHAFVTKSEAIPQNKRGIGVEHASKETIQKALQDAQRMVVETEEQISVDDLITARLIGGTGARKRRERLGQLLHIGYTNGKQLHKRLQTFCITKEVFRDAIAVIREEESNE